MARSSSSQAVLAFRSSVQRDADILPDLDVRDLQTADGYRSLLSKGTPILRLLPAEELLAIAGWISQHPPQRSELRAMIEQTAAGLNGAVSSEATKRCLLTFVSAQAFEREPEGSPLSEQRLTLQPDIGTPEALLALLRNAARTKLAAVLGQVRDDVLDQLLGETAAPVSATDSGRN